MNHRSNEPNGTTRRQALAVLGGCPALALFADKAAAGEGEGDDGETADGADWHRHVSLDTRLVREYGVRFPIVSAGMAFVGLTDLAAAVSNAGGIGVYGAAPEPPPVVDARVAELAARAAGPFGVDFIIASTPLGEFTTQDHIDVVAARRVPIVVFHFGVPPRGWVDQLHAAGSRVWVQAGSVDLAQGAADVGADAIIAQGASAGGHNRNLTIPTLALLSMIRAQVRGHHLILAAGGIADGESLVRALHTGADGAWMGTRFVASAEAYAHPDYKARLVRAKGRNATTFTTVFGPEFPGRPQRVLRNRAVTSPPSTEPPVIGTTTLFPGVVDAPYQMPKYSAIVPTRDTQGDLDEMDMPAGSESILAIDQVRPAGEIVADVIADARHVIEHGPGHA